MLVDFKILVQLPWHPFHGMAILQLFPLTMVVASRASLVDVENRNGYHGSTPRALQACNCQQASPRCWTTLKIVTSIVLQPCSFHQSNSTMLVDFKIPTMMGAPGNGHG